MFVSVRHRSNRQLVQILRLLHVILVSKFPVMAHHGRSSVLQNVALSSALSVHMWVVVSVMLTMPGITLRRKTALWIMVFTCDRTETLGIMMIRWPSVIMTVLCSGSVLLILLMCTLYVCTLGTHVVFSTMMITWLRIVFGILSGRRIVFSVATTRGVVVLIRWYPIFFVSARFLWCLFVIQNICVRLGGGGEEENAWLLAVLLSQDNGRNGGIWQLCISTAAEKLTSLHMLVLVHVFVLIDIRLLTFQCITEFCH